MAAPFIKLARSPLSSHVAKSTTHEAASVVVRYTDRVECELDANETNARL